MTFARWTILFVLLAAPAWAEAKDPIAASVVKIFATQRRPDFVRPWNKGNANEATGSGVVIEGKRILTNTHVVLHTSQIFVQGNESTERVPAKILVLAPGMDLAVLQVEKPSFFDERPPLPLAEDIPAVKQTVSVYGYPVGGEQISVTQGIVSRIECTIVSYETNGLRIQIDAAINPGNSGGPAVADGRIVGLVHSKLIKGENIGYLIAAEEIRTFLDDIQDGTYDGKPMTWDVVQSAENEALRAKLGLDKQTGVVVCHPFSSAPEYPIKKWDLIMRIGDVPVDNQGNVKIKEDLRVSCNYLISKLAKDGHVRSTVFRDGKTLDLDVPVRPDSNSVMPFLMDKYPRYFICGPMVFMPASREFAMGLAESPFGIMILRADNPILSRLMDHPAFEGEEIVTLGRRLLPHKTSKGYDPTPFSVVSRLNGVTVRNLAHLVELIRDAKDEFLTIELAGDSSALVFKRKEILDATDDILSDEGIRKQYSDDLESVWHPGK